MARERRWLQDRIQVRQIYDDTLADLTRALELNPDQAWTIASRGETSHAFAAGFSGVALRRHRRRRRRRRRGRPG